MTAMTSRSSLLRRGAGVLVFLLVASATHAQTPAGRPAQRPRAAFQVEEATIAQIQRALVARRLSTVGLVERYLARIKAYNGTCVREPQGLLGPITTIRTRARSTRSRRSICAPPRAAPGASTSARRAA